MARVQGESSGFSWGAAYVVYLADVGPADFDAPAAWNARVAGAYYRAMRPAAIASLVDRVVDGLTVGGTFVCLTLSAKRHPLVESSSKPLSEHFQEYGTGALVAEALRTAARAAFRMLDQKIELFPHHIVCIRRCYQSRMRRQSVVLYRIGFWSLRWRHRSTSRTDLLSSGICFYFIETV